MFKDDPAVIVEEAVIVMGYEQRHFTTAQGATRKKKVKPFFFW